MINSDWNKIFIDYGIDKKIEKILKYISDNYNVDEVYPKKEDLFKALNLTPFSSVKVVIIGQDPYHGIGEANGLAFSLNENVKITPSLRNIFKELETDLNIKRTKKDLSEIAKQGVLFLNTILTVSKDKPLSHKDIGWEEITDFIIKYISDNKKDVVYILWGNNAKKKSALIDDKSNFIISSNHPSPLSASRGFFNSKPFSRTNNFLKEKNQTIIDWSL